MASDLQNVPVAEGKVSRGKHGLVRLHKLICVPLKCAARPSWHSIGVPSVLRKLLGWSIHEICLAVAIRGICTDVRSAVACDDGIFSRVAAVKHLDQSHVPVSKEAMVAIELQLVRLVVVVFLQPIACVVAVLSLFVGYFLHDKSRWSLISLCFSDKFFDTLQQI